MSNDYINGLTKAKAEGTLDTYNPISAAVLETEENIPNNIVAETEETAIKPEVNLNEVNELSEEFSTLDKFGIYGQAFGGEIITNVATTATLVKGLGYLNTVKNISKFGIVAPEGTSTVAGLVTYAGAEAVGGVVGNLVNQSVLKAYGLDKTEGYNVGELVTSAVFNVGLVHKPIEAAVGSLGGLAKEGKIFSFIAPSIQSLKSWRSGEYIIKGTQQFVSGAAIGLAESALRQSIEGTLNFDEDSTFDLLFSAGAGGTVQSAFSLLLRKGKAGRQQVVDIVDDAKNNLEQKKKQLQETLQEAEKPLPPSISYGFGGGLAQAARANQRHQASKEIQEIETAQAILDDSLDSVKKSNDKIDAREKELGETELTAEEVLETQPVEEPEPATPKPEEAEVKLEEEPTVVEEPVVEKPINVDEPLEAPEVTETVKRERFVDDAREDKLDELEERMSKLEVTPDKGALTLEAPILHREGKKLADETAEKVSNLIRIIAKNPKSIDINIAKELLNEIKFTRRFNKNVADWWNTLGGRLLQSQKKEQYDWEGRYSERAELQDEALARLQATLEAKTRGVIDGDEADIQGMFDEYLAIPEELKKRRRLKPTAVKEDDEIQEAFKEPKVEEEVDVEKQPTDKAEQSLLKRKKKLQERLKELQERFGDPTNLTKEQKKQLQDDPDIADLKERIKFYDAAEKDFLEVKRLEAELAKVSELDVAPIGEQREAVTPKPKAPTKPATKATELRSKIATVKANIKQRLADIDKARREMDEGFQAEKAEQAFQKKINTLQTELDELRATFGKEPEELVPTAPKEKDPRVKDLEDKIKFYKDAQSEVRRIKELETERARLLEIETGPLGRQRAEIEAKPTRPKKAPGRVQELTKDIADLRKNMRNRVREIDRARVEMSDEFKAEQLRKAYENKRSKLENELDGLRKRFSEIDKEATAAGLVSKKTKEDDPRIKELKAKIKYYKEAEKEAKLVADLEKKLARVADIEGRAIVGELRKEVAPTPKGPTKTLKSKLLQQKIAESKKRMRQKLNDLDRARKEIEDIQLTARIFREIEDALYKQLEADVSSKITRGWRFVQTLRQLSLIDQLPSIFAGIPTGLGAGFKQFFRPITTFFYNADNAALPVRTRLALADATAAFKLISDLKGLWTEARRTFAENASAIDSRAGKLSDEISVSKAPRGIHSIVTKGYRSAKRRAEAAENVSNAFNRFIKNGDFFYLWSIGVRGIQSIDSVFKRQLFKSRIYARSQKKAILEFPNDPQKAKERAREIYNAQWKDSDGLAVLKEKTEFDDDLNQIREELLLAADGDLQDMPIDPVEKLIGQIKEHVNDGGFFGAFVDAFAPYIGVPIRSVFRGGKITLAPLQVLAQGALSKIPGARGQINPFSRKIKELDLKLKFEFDLLKKIDDPEKIKTTRQRIKTLSERRNKTAERRLRYNEELLTDAMLSVSLLFVGSSSALYYGGTGSLEWLTPDQRRNNKLESFKIFGMDYSAALPWAFPIALSADVAAWFRLKAEERETGKTILTKDQTLAYVIGASFKKLAEAMPLAQGVETAQEIAAFEGDVTKNAISRLIASYVPIPAEVRKINQTVNQKGIPDLRGGTYWERVAYSVLGSGVGNLKTDRLGEDEQNTANWVTNTIIRQAPRDELIRSDFDKIVASDTHKNLSNKPSTLTVDIKMTEWRNEDGMTLSYAFDQRLKRKVVSVKQLGNKKYTIKQAVSFLIKDPKWIAKYSKGFQPDEETGLFVNEGLSELNSVLNKFYNETKKEIIKDSSFTNKFVNEDNESLYYILKTRGSATEPIGRPLAPFEILERR